MTRRDVALAIGDLQKGLTPQYEIIKLAPRTFSFGVVGGKLVLPGLGFEVAPARANRWKFMVAAANQTGGSLFTVFELATMPSRGPVTTGGAAPGVGIPLGGIVSRTLLSFTDKPPCYKGAWYLIGTSIAAG